MPGVDELELKEQTTRFMAADRCHCIDCSLCLLLIIIKVSLPFGADLLCADCFV
jgi:hypothetical protein